MAAEKRPEPAEKRPEPARERADDAETGSEVRQPTVLLPPEKSQPGFLKRWWSNPLVRQVLGIVVVLTLIAGVIGVLTLRLQQSPAQSGSSGSGASAAEGGGAAAAEENRSVSERFSALQDSLEAAVARYETRREQFDQARAGQEDTSRAPVDCDDLASVYQRVDDSFVALAAEYQSSRRLLKTEERTRFQELFDRVAEVNRDFDQSGCPRPD